MEILDFDYDTNRGVAWILVSGEGAGEVLNVQCCLVTGDYDPERDSGPVPFLEEIDASGCGHNDGICGDVNAAAFEFWGENRCMKALFKKAKEAGLTVDY